MKKINIKRMLGVVGLLAVAVPATLSVVACGIRTEVKRIDLNTLILTTVISGQENQTEEDALQSFLSVNKNIADLESSIEIKEGSFDSATYVADGALIVSARENTKYSGEVKVTISKLGQTDLNMLDLNIVIPGNEIVTSEDAFQSFLSVNKNIFGDNLTLDQVELSNFQKVEIMKDGKLTISVRAGINSKYTGLIDITLKYVLSDSNIVDMIRYLSDNNLLNFSVPTGTLQGPGGSNLLAVLIKEFRKLMNGNYEYADNIKSFELYTYNYGPNQEQLNTKGFVWHSPKELFIIIAVIYKDGSQQKIEIDNVNTTITMV